LAASQKGLRRRHVTAITSEKINANNSELRPEQSEVVRGK
jgi:hypothetical protein